MHNRCPLLAAAFLLISLADGVGQTATVHQFSGIASGGDNNTFMQQFRDAYTNLFGRLTHNAYYAHLNNSHCDFNETPWFDSPASTTLIRRALVQDLYTVSFFRKYLRAEDDHFLDGPPAQWPEVDVFLKK